MARRLPHQLGRDQLQATLPVVVAHQLGGFHKPLPLFRKGSDPLLLSLAWVCPCWSCMSLADDYERGLKPPKTHKASINESFTSLAQCEFAYVEIIHPQLMTARKDLNPQEYIKLVLTSLYCPPLSICIITR